jgi:hypothetical protein
MRTRVVSQQRSLCEDARALHARHNLAVSRSTARVWRTYVVLCARSRSMEQAACRRKVDGPTCHLDLDLTRIIVKLYIVSHYVCMHVCSYVRMYICFWLLIYSTQEIDDNFGGLAALKNKIFAA